MKRKKLHKTKTMMLLDSSAVVAESEKEASQNIFTTKIVPRLLKKLLYSAAILLCAAESEQAPRDGRERERACAREERERAMLHNLLTALVLIPNLSRTSRDESEPISEPIYSGDPGPQSLPNLILFHRQGIREFGSGGGVFLQHQQNLGLSTRMRCLYGWMNHVRIYDYRPRCFHRCKLDQHHLQG
jgi:hypothetical protein